MASVNVHCPRCHR
ncbi:hypothetical protein BV501_12805, partial [Erwinia sp. OAMSP11]